LGKLDVITDVDPFDAGSGRVPASKWLARANARGFPASLRNACEAGRSLFTLRRASLWKRDRASLKLRHRLTEKVNQSCARAFQELVLSGCIWNGELQRDRPIPTRKENVRVGDPLATCGVHSMEALHLQNIRHLDHLLPKRARWAGTLVL